MTKAVAKRAEAEAVAVVEPTSESAAILNMIERVARDPSVDIARIERLYDLHQAAASRSAKTQFLAAFARLQADLPAVERKGTGHNNKKYARFEDFIEKVKPELAKHGFSLSFRIAQEPTTIKVTGVLGHEAGHIEETSLTLPADTTGNKNPVQAWGSSISYGKRYVGLTLLGIATEDEDDDGKKSGAVETITEEQAADLKKLMEKANLEDQIIFEHFKVAALTELTPDQLKTATAKLNKKLVLSS